MAVFFRFRAMAEQRDRLVLRQFLNQSQRKLLPMISDDLIVSIGPAALKHFRLIPARVGVPINRPFQKTFEQRFARSQVCHPNVIARFLYPSPPKASHENAQAVFFRIDRGMNRFCSKHCFHTPCRRSDRRRGCDRRMIFFCAYSLRGAAKAPLSSN